MARPDLDPKEIGRLTPDVTIRAGEKVVACARCEVQAAPRLRAAPRGIEPAVLRTESIETANLELLAPGMSSHLTVSWAFG